MYVIGFDSDQGTDIAVVGGKGANLGRLAAAGFQVPAGYTISTEAYAVMLATDGVHDALSKVLAGIDVEDVDRLDRDSAAIREILLATEVPAAAVIEIRAAYQALPGEPHVAVRSSGTAEDLAGTSFAGMHDTYLDVRGGDDVVAAVQRCWASMWTSRAIAYRQRNEFDHFTAQIAVVVQTMVGAEVSGVMFTANPLNAATDELLINASWGLGEAVVAGITSPDQFVVKWHDLRIRERVIGAKELQVVRDPHRGTGTVHEEVPAARRQVLTLGDEQVRQLAELGRAVTEHYDGIPQDTEWAYAQGTFHLLQSRPITGVELSWDADVDITAGSMPEEREDEYWTRAWIDEVWTGPITPLFYSVRGPSWVRARDDAMLLYGHEDLTDIRFLKFHKGEAYWSLDFEKKYVERTMPPAFRRSGIWDHLPASWLQETLEKKFDYLSYAKMYGITNFGRPDRDRIWGWFKAFKEDYFESPIRGPEFAAGLPDEKLRQLSDTGLRLYVDRYVKHEDRYNATWWTPAFFYFRDAVCGLKVMLDAWYDGDNPAIFTDLISGTSERTPTLVESHTLWTLAQLIKSSEQLSSAMQEYGPDEFFRTCDDTDDGRDFLAAYHDFLATSSHRGHADRDVFFPRRCDDPAIDYNALKSYLDVDRDPEDREHEVAARHAAAVEDAVANIARRPLGALKVEAFKLLVGWLEKFIVIRDTERNYIDRSTFTLRRAFLEVGRRLTARGVVESVDDVWFLTMEELWTLLGGHGNRVLLNAKIAGRKRNHERLMTREWTPPMYLQNNVAVDLDSDLNADLGPGVFQGVGTSTGVVTGTARVVKTLAEVGRVNKHEILVCNATDPGWTSVFNIIDGIVTETGGALAHAACLAREYGLPAAQVPSAMRLIPDGATITIDGGTGRVTVIDELEAAS